MDSTRHSQDGQHQAPAHDVLDASVPPPAGDTSALPLSQPQGPHGIAGTSSSSDTAAAAIHDDIKDTAATSTAQNEEPTTTVGDSEHQKETEQGGTVDALIDAEGSGLAAPVSSEQDAPSGNSTGRAGVAAADSPDLINATQEQGQRQSEGVERQQQASLAEEEEAPTNPNEWPLKIVHWPPSGNATREVKILMQDLNGPCSFLALCNVLLLRGDITLAHDAKTATFAQLSGLVADYLLRSSTGVPLTPSLPQNALDFALNIMPKTLQGLDVNVNFLTGDFSRPEGTPPGELELFKLASVDFRHGWLASEDDAETYEVLLEVANDYDTAVNVLVEGDTIAEGNITGNSGGSAGAAASGAAGAGAGGPFTPTTGVSGSGNMQKLEQLFEDLSMEPNKQAKVYQATIIKRFLESTGTQLTYAGLFKLSEALQPGSLCALFRNSHFSVLYRRPDAFVSDDGPQPEAQQSFDGAAAQTIAGRLKLPSATLFQLVTDQALLHEPNAVWESLEDVDGAASRFFDSRLQPAKIRQDWVSRTERQPADIEARDTQHDADMALAAQLQQDEYDSQEQARQAPRDRRRHNVQFADHSGTGNSSQQPSEEVSASRRSSIGGTRPEEVHPRVLSGLGVRSSKKDKAKEPRPKKEKKGCIIC